jgi:periplasmic protein CpxP/Spy
MKRILNLIALSILVFLANQLDAQNNSDKREARMQERRMDEIKKMKADLALTDDQTAKIKTLMEEKRKRGASLKEMDEAERRETMMAFNEEMKTILTSEQYEKFKSRMKERAGNARQKRDPKQ